MPHPRQCNLAEESYKILIPQEYLLDFEVNHIENNPQEWIIELVEKEELFGFEEGEVKTIEEAKELIKLNLKEKEKLTYFKT